MKINKNLDSTKIMASLMAILLVCAALLAFFVLKTTQLPEQKTRVKEKIEILTLASHELSKLWKEGDLDSLWKNGELNCADRLGDSKETNDSYLKCNPDYLQCYFDYLDKKNLPHLKVIHENKLYKLKLNKFYKGDYFQVVSKSYYKNPNLPIYGVIVEISLNNKENFRVILKDTCYEIPLPERRYSLGEMPDDMEEDYRWDNFNRNIFVDKHLVTNRDIREWNETTGMVKAPFDSAKLSAPATRLKLNQMKEFCRFHGKELLRAIVFDAATFLPLSLEEQSPEVNIRSPWPYTKRKKDGFLYKASTEEYYEFKTRECKNAYILECKEKLPYEYFNFWSISWIGVTGSLGGYMEAFDNIINPKRNLKTSSFYFPAKSKVHRLGRRDYWDGQGFNLSNFELSEEIDMNYLKGHELEVAFRCMRIDEDE